DIFGELDVYVSGARKGDRANSIVRSCAGMNRLILGNSVLDGSGEKLLNLLRRSTRPSAEGYRDPDRNVRVFSLRPASIAKPPPNEDADKQHPRDLWVLHKR